MLLIGERISVISKRIGAAMKERDAAPIIDMAKRQAAAGADYIDISIGPATKDGPELMEWLVTQVQAEVDKPICLDTTNAGAIEAGLKVHNGQAMINSTSGDEERMDSMIPLAAKYGAKLIGLTMTDKGIPRDANERVMIAAEILGRCMVEGVSPDDLYLDPLVLSITTAQSLQPPKETFEALTMFRELSDPHVHTVVGLSNISNGAPSKLKNMLTKIYLVFLMNHGLDSAILDPMDNDLMGVLRTAEIFRNDTLYFDSFLDPYLED